MLMMNRLSDRIVGHYERHATAWDADRAGSAWNDKPWHDRFVAMLPKGASILDLGCGSGSPVARHMAANGLKVTGVDSSGVAAEHGFTTGDVILEVAGKSVSSPAEVRDAIASVHAEGKRTVLMRVKKGEGTRFVALPVGNG